MSQFSVGDIYSWNIEFKDRLKSGHFRKLSKLEIALLDLKIMNNQK